MLTKIARTMELQEVNKSEIINNVKIVKPILKKHGVPYSYSLIRAIATTFRVFRLEKEEGSIRGIPALIKLLKSCEGSDIEIKGIIKKPIGNQVKGTEMKVTISAGSTILQNMLCDAVAMVENKCTDVQTEFNNYTEEDFLNFINTDDNTFFPKNDNAKLVKLAWGILLAFKFSGIHNEKTPLYSCIYDLMLAFGYTGKKESITEDGNSGAIGNQKMQYIRRWLNAWYEAQEHTKG